jgi:hypothetical protein
MLQSYDGEKQFELKDAVDLLYKQTTIINSLWGMYVLATFAAGGFAALTGDLATKKLIASALTVAFLAFTLGHAIILKVELDARWKLAQEIKLLLSAETESTRNFAESIKLVVRTATTTYKGLIAHVSIDTCVIVAIWVRVLQRGVT